MSAADYCVTRNTDGIRTLTQSILTLRRSFLDAWNRTAKPRMISRSKWPCMGRSRTVMSVMTVMTVIRKPDGHMADYRNLTVNRTVKTLLVGHMGDYRNLTVTGRPWEAYVTADLITRDLRKRDFTTRDQPSVRNFTTADLRNRAPT